MADCQGAQGQPGQPGSDADVCAVYAILGQVPPFGSGLPCAPTMRFVDNGDGTITDNQTGLMWEKKTACGAQDLNDPHCVENRYAWSTSFLDPNGTLYSDFLVKLNSASPEIDSVTGELTEVYGDWRIPTRAELEGILVEPNPCGPTPCIDAAFGPTQASFYWSSATNALFPLDAWFVDFNNGFVFFNLKGSGNYARGVRGGR